MIVDADISDDLNAFGDHESDSEASITENSNESDDSESDEDNKYIILFKFRRF